MFIYCSVAIGAIIFIFHWIYYDYTERLNYYLTAPNQKLCLFNALRQYLKTYDAELLVVPSVLFCVIAYLTKHYKGDITMLILQIPGWIFLLDTLLSELLSHSPVDGVFNAEGANTRFPYPFNIMVSCLAALALTRYTPNIYPAISGAFCMAYML